MSLAQEHSPGAAGREGPGFHLGYRRWLDGLRGIAVLSVLLYHLWLLPGGFIGVDVFFVLSGFLITCLLIEEWQGHGSISLTRFYLRRGLRLLPALFSVVLVCFLLTWRFGAAGELAVFRREMVVAVCYVANWPMLHHTAMPTLGHTWSLSVEEQFYLLWPVLLYGMLRIGFSRRGVIGVVCLGILASLSLRAVLCWRHRHCSFDDQLGNTLRMYFGLDTRADALLLGCLAGLLAAWDLLPRSGRLRFWAELVAVYCATPVVFTYIVLTRNLANRELYYGGFTLVALCVAGVVTRLLSGPVWVVSAVLESRLLAWVGRISYSLYLVHIPVLCWLRRAGLGGSSPAQKALAAGLSFVVAGVSYYCVERPCLRLRHRLRYSTPGTPRTAGPHPYAAGAGAALARRAA